MADLDEFFAKKGKKKKKTKATVQSLQESETASSKLEEEKQQPLPVVSPEDSEWRESTISKVEINPDDIQGVNLLKDEDSDESPDNKMSTEDTLQEDTKIITKGSVTSPWQPVSSSQPEESRSQTTVTSLAGTSKGAYKPPGARRKNPKAPPDISSTQAFPSLQVSMKKEESQPPPVMKDYTELPLQNKFSALRTE